MVKYGTQLVAHTRLHERTQLVLDQDGGPRGGSRKLHSDAGRVRIHALASYGAPKPYTNCIRPVCSIVVNRGDLDMAMAVKEHLDESGWSRLQRRGCNKL